MAANLLENALRALSGFPVSKVVAWSDSTVTLHWIKENGQYKQFVKNRVDKIRCKTPITWRYVNTEENPADLGSRGCEGHHLTETWFKRPLWLKDDSEWPNDITTESSTESESGAEISRKL